MKIKEEHELYIYLTIVFGLFFLLIYIITGMSEGMVQEGMKNMTLTKTVTGLFRISGW